MTSGDLLGQAVGELYSADPEEFTRRRGELAAQARAAGQAAAARQIAGLRKPTRSAWVINQLARADPEAADRLAGLGEELRAAERSRDGSRMRELSQARRQLIAALVRQALAVSGQQSAPAAMREEITSTLAAALADPEVAEQIRHATLLRPAQRAGFGTALGPELALVPPPAAGTSPAGTERAGTERAGAEQAEGDAEPDRQAGTGVGARAASARRGGRTGAEQAEGEAEPDRQVEDEAARARAEAAEAEAERARAEAAEAERARAEAERRAQARAEAERALGEADDALQAARAAEQELSGDFRRLEEQLADLRRRLHEARTTTRQAQIAQRTARQILGRLPE